ncbi:hypothetical protein LPJ66_009580 [Kickxella alabastrina]|uniref:Uncharacterized protein n=1 Tax=Kickxella alabastrina TaxID=61397 RepID=A0ACC1I6H4_9FUNG|nr:hypothetical protein LPJ66_009580 [Kickxella alabastrina]
MDFLAVHRFANTVQTAHLFARQENVTAPDITTATAEDLHGVLGQWAVVCNGINISSMVCSIIVILSTIVVAFVNRSLLNRPSLRISTCIALCDLSFSICQVFVFNNDYMSGLSETHLRAIVWIMAGSNVSFVFLSSCMGIQLLLTVLTNKNHWAEAIRPYYEVTSIFCGFLITHPYMYVFKNIKWIPVAQLFYFREEESAGKRNIWLVQWMWIFGGVAFLFVIALLTYIKMSRAWKATETSINRYRTPEKLDLLDLDSDSDTMQQISDERKRYIRSVTLRVTCYPIIPIITLSFTLLCNLLSATPFWLYVMSNLMPSTQGMLNFLVYTMNPSLDVYRKRLAERTRGAKRRTRARFGKLEGTESMSDFPITFSEPSSVYSDRDNFKYTA